MGKEKVPSFSFELLPLVCALEQTSLVHPSAIFIMNSSPPNDSDDMPDSIREDITTNTGSMAKATASAFELLLCVGSANIFEEQLISVNRIDLADSSIKEVDNDDDDRNDFK
mmetsp:Transcript_53343/g.53762  ORF Transcript_53343/g.53762 Transcript_53343/m.53762 type:complete len:112 (-) Transcript_53343:103-438(-)